MMETTTTMKKRPRGMTFLLVLSFINACWNIISSMISYIITPRIGEMIQNGQMEEMMEPFSAMFSEEQQQMVMDGMKMMAQIDPKYHLFLAILFIGSLVGVIRMFKGDKRGLHIYGISQILMLFDASIYLYPKQPQSGFFSELLLTFMFILLYYLYFKRMEMQDNMPQSPDAL